MPSFAVRKWGHTNNIDDDERLLGFDEHMTVVFIIAHCTSFCTNDHNLT